VETVALEVEGLQVGMAAMVVQEEMAGTEATAEMVVTDKLLSPGPVGR
jgi:hypothetical protein